MKGTELILLFICILSVAAGGLLYLYIRPDALLSRAVGMFISIKPAYINSDFVNYYLCDMLWAFSLVLALFLVIKRRVAAVLIAAGFSIITELLQLLGIMPGTFDFYDILAETVAEAAAVLLIMLLCGRKKYEKK